MELPTDRVRARRIGLVADTHSAKSDGSDLPQAVLDALRDAELIVHLGDMGATGSLDRFATIAPVIATRGGHAVGSDPRIASEARVIEAGRSRSARSSICPRARPRSRSSPAASSSS